jgi:hypothetical protein
MAKPLQLSPTQQETLLRAAYPLAPADKEIFAERVIEQLAAAPELGDGLVSRVCRAVQRELWNPPIDELRYRHGPHLMRKLG